MVTPWHSEKVPGLRESELGSHPLPPSRDEVWLTSNRLVLTSSTSCYHEHCYCTVAQSPSHVWLFVTTWTAAFTVSQSLLKLMSIEPAVSSNHLMLCCPFSSCLQSFPASGSFPMSQFFASGGQSIGASASVLVLPMNIQDWFPLEWTAVISLQFKGLSRVFSSF